MAKSTNTLKSISNLPEGIIHHIFSFLQAKEEIRASLLSLAWLNAWRTKPKLLFGDSDFSLGNLAINARTLVKYREEKIGINTLKFHLEDWDSRWASEDLVDNWMHVAVQNGVKILSFFWYNWSLDEAYVLPSTVFQATSLVYLYIFGSSLKLQESEKIRCSNLKYLKLICSVTDESTFAKIMSSCKLIENLMIFSSDGFNNLKVTKVQKLKRIELFSLQDFNAEIESSNLEYFKWENFDPSVIDPTMGIDSTLTRLTLHACPNLKSLKLLGLSITDDFFFNFNHKFPNLGYLSITYCLHLERVKISSFSLKMVDFHLNKRLKEVQLHIPNMIWFNYDGKIICKNDDKMMIGKDVRIILSSK